MAVGVLVAVNVALFYWDRPREPAEGKLPADAEPQPPVVRVWDSRVPIRVVIKEKDGLRTIKEYPATFAPTQKTVQLDAKDASAPVQIQALSPDGWVDCESSWVEHGDYHFPGRISVHVDNQAGPDAKLVIGRATLKISAAAGDHGQIFWLVKHRNEATVAIDGKVIGIIPPPRQVSEHYLLDVSGKRKYRLSFIQYELLKPENLGKPSKGQRGKLKRDVTFEGEHLYKLPVGAAGLDFFLTLAPLRKDVMVWNGSAPILPEATQLVRVE